MLEAGAMEAIHLRVHPTTPCPAVRELSVVIGGAAAVHLTYVLRGDLDAIAIPAPAAPRPADALWRHTCFEAFVAPDVGPEYREFNFSPSGEWAAYGFASYRDRVELDPRSLAPALAWTRAADALTLAVTLPLAPPLRLGLSAVVETRRGALSYWALHHPAPRPDFHHADGFTLRVAAC